MRKWKSGHRLSSVVCSSAMVAGAAFPSAHCAIFRLLLSCRFNRDYSFQ